MPIWWVACNRPREGCINRYTLLTKNCWMITSGLRDRKCRRAVKRPFSSPLERSKRRTLKMSLRSNLNDPFLIPLHVQKYACFPYLITLHIPSVCILLRNSVKSCCYSWPWCLPPSGLESGGSVRSCAACASCRRSAPVWFEVSCSSGRCRSTRSKTSCS